MRSQFPIFQQLVNGHALAYLDNAATTQRPQSVIDAISHFYAHDNANVHRGAHTLGNRATAAFENARERAARFIHARGADEIIFTRGTTEGINLVAHVLGASLLQPGDQVLLTEMEHHANLVPWQLLAQRHGIEIVYAPVQSDATLDETRLAELIRNLPRIKLFAFVHVSNLLGTINPAAELCAIARDRSVLTLVDAAQSAGHLPLDAQEIGCDFLAFSSHKMCGPTGVGVLYGRRELLNSLPPWQGGGEMIREVDFGRTLYAEPPYRFEAGTPNIAGAVGLHAAMDFLDQVGRARIFEHDQELASYGYEQLSRVNGVRILGAAAGRAAILSFELAGVHPHDLVTFADQQGIALRGGHHCAQPLMRKLGLSGTTRASFYLYNTRDEIGRLVEVVREVKKLFSD